MKSVKRDCFDTQTRGKLVFDETWETCFHEKNPQSYKNIFLNFVFFFCKSRNHLPNWFQTWTRTLGSRAKNSTPKRCSSTSIYQGQKMLDLEQNQCCQIKVLFWTLQNWHFRFRHFLNIILQITVQYGNFTFFCHSDFTWKQF